MVWRIEIDGRACTASGMCAALAPGRFALEGSHAEVLPGPVEADDVLLDAADSCPASAITVLEAGVPIAPRG
ncbi:ferredoxin [Streptomyces sp. TRM 70351]|uniref:ferredoxin n=1 Tax=Streptomyces sp. TRM 70351 TaxID=3116552 RepID=UPI002E7AF6C2|nr:ferredoxin [Streptomyces sp. TRM 70351]MEE1926988.1 ferredoxin [Streptomyces sp. TRM 70351]